MTTAVRRPRALRDFECEFILFACKFSDYVLLLVVLAKPPHSVQYALDPYVIAADNMEIIHDSSLIKDDMFPWAGKYFKRFDHETCTFVSNMREEYPDD
jgi:hypothetical protein